MDDTSTSDGSTSPISSNAPASLADASPPPSFSAHTVPEEKQIKKTAFYIRKALSPKAQKLGYMYVTKQVATRFCKVGWAEKDAQARVKTVEQKCKVVTESPYRIGPFFGAYRAERVLHCLLEHRRRLWKNCPCGCVNQEWYHEDYQEVIRQAEIVCSWMCRDPCPYGRMAQEHNLEPAWEQALERWLARQGRKVLPSWNTFFLFGLSVDVVIDGPRFLSPPSLQSQLSSGEFMEQFTSIVVTKLARDRKTIHDKTEGNTIEAKQVKRQETWDHWFPAPDTNMTAGVVSEQTVVDEQATVSSSTSISHIRHSAASVPTAEHTAIADMSQEDDSHSTDRAKSSAGEATIDISKRSATPSEATDAETADLGQQSYTGGDEDIADISEMLARMPGAFPAEHMDGAPTADMQVCLYKEASVSYISQDFLFIKNADGTLCCEKIPDYATEEIHKNPPEIPELRTFLVDQNNVVTGVPGTPPITDELFSRVASPSRAEAQCPPVADAPACSGDTQVESAGPDSRRGRTNDAGSALTSASSTAPRGGHFSSLPWAWTAVIPFTPLTHLEDTCSGSTTTYQSITAMYWYREHSFEELRWADYNNGRRFAEQRKPEFVEEDSDLETSSSLSDDDRPRAKQRGLEKELRDLCEESLWYDYGLDCQRMEYETPHQRLRRLADNLRTMSSPSTGKTAASTWDNWPEEASENELEDESWADIHGRETMNEDAVDQCEHDTKSTSPPTSPGHQRETLPGSPCLICPHPLHAPLTAQSDPIEYRSIPTVQFTSPTFDFTRPFPSCTTPPPAPQSPFSGMKRSENCHSKSNDETRSSSSPVDSQGGHDSEHILAGSDNDSARPERPKERQKRTKPNEDANVATTPPLDLAKLKSHDDRDYGEVRDDVTTLCKEQASEAKLDVEGFLQPSDRNTPDVAAADGAPDTDAPPRTTETTRAGQRDPTPLSGSHADNALAKQWNGQLVLAIKSEAHQWKDEEAPACEADVSDIGARHLPLPAAACGPDGRLGLGDNRTDTFRPEDFLGQWWQFDVG